MALDGPVYLWTLLVVPVFAAASLLSMRRVAAWQRRFGGEAGGRSVPVLRMVLIGLVLLLVSAALARPKVQVLRTVFNRSGIDLIVGIDVSKSMLAEDAALSAEAGRIFPVANRLNRARDFALEILSELRGERIGVFLFASRGVEVVPLTRDYGFCRYILRYIQDAEITVPGSDLGEAVRTGMSMFEEEGAKAARVLVLLSDGEDTSSEPSSFSEAAALAARSGIRIFPVGIGSGKSVLIPVRSEDGNSIAGYYLDEEGNHLKTRLEKEPLKTIAGLTGARYFSAEEANAPEEIMKSILQGAREVEYTKGVEPAWLECSPFLLLAGFVFFSWGTWVGR